MFEIIVGALALFALGVVLEYHFGLYERARALLLTLALLVGRLVSGLLAFLGRLLLPAAFVGSALALALMLVALIMSLEPPAPALVPRGNGMSLWTFVMDIIAFFTFLIAIPLKLLWWLVEQLAMLVKGIVVWVAIGLSALVPSCEKESAPVVAERWERLPLTPQVLEAPARPPLSITVEVEEGDGCISATRRAGRPLTLRRCLEFTRAHGLRPVWNARGLIEAPRLYPDDVLVWEEGRGWALLR